MATQNIPIILQAQPIAYGVRAADINQLMTIISQNLSAFIRQDVSFFLQGTVNPVSNQGLFFNTSSNQFQVWDSGLGRYVPVTSLSVGDMKQTFISGDSPTQGWITLDGRLLTGISGISQAQFLNLQSMFGTASNARLPDIQSINSVTNLPSTGSFSSIEVKDVTPPDGQIGALPISTTYTPAEVSALASNTETLRDSSAATVESLNQIKTMSENVLAALNGGTTGTTTYWKVFVGYP